MNKFTYAIAVVVSPNDSDERLINSLNSLIKQSELPDEILILKNGSLNIFKNKVIEKFVNLYASEVKVLEVNSILDFASALNVLIRECRSDYFIRHDPDDISLSNRIAVIKSEINNYEYDFFCSAMLEYDRNSQSLSYRLIAKNLREIKNKLVSVNPINHSTVVFSKKLINNFHGYEINHFAEDYLLWLKVFSTELKVGVSPVPLVIFDSTNKLIKRTSYKLFNSELKILKYKIYNKFNPFISLLAFIARIFFTFLPVKFKYLLTKIFFKSDNASYSISPNFKEFDFPLKKDEILEILSFDVVIPNFNRQIELENAIQSVINQDIQNKINIYVVDDCSSKKIEINTKVKKNQKIHFLKTSSPSGGPSIPRNLGLERVQSDLIAFLDSDDTWKINHLRESLNYAPFGRIYAQNIKGKTIKKFGLNSLLKDNLVITSSVVVPNNIITKVGFFPYSSSHSIYEDYAYWLKCSTFANFFLDGKATVKYVVDSMDSYRNSYKKDFVCLKNTFDNLLFFYKPKTISKKITIKFLMNYRLFRSFLVSRFYFFNK